MIKAVFGFIIVVALVYAYERSTSGGKKESKKIDCSNSKGFYSSGYSAGETCRMLNGINDCSGYANDYNASVGRDVLIPNECFCEGFEAGFKKEKKEY